MTPKRPVLNMHNRWKYKTNGKAHVYKQIHVDIDIIIQSWQVLERSLCDFRLSMFQVLSFCPGFRFVSLLGLIKLMTKQDIIYGNTKVHLWLLINSEDDMTRATKNFDSTSTFICSSKIVPTYHYSISIIATVKKKLITNWSIQSNYPIQV